MLRLKETAPSIENHFYDNHVQMLLDSYLRLLRRPLIGLGDADNYAEQVYRAEFVLVSHNNDADPLFNYANHTGLQLFERRWDEFVGLPSCYSVEPDNIEGRRQLLEQVSANGYIENYAGVRIAKSGRRFRINHATVWNVHDQEGMYIGQAASFSDWDILP
ncbi:MAG: MEKHLA domain-containing protein [Methylovulum sp.]|nr:MEKHLA domain-containing protein [Methylovulum sp.]